MKKNKPVWHAGKAFCGACGMILPKRKYVSVCRFCPACGTEIDWK